MNQMPYPYIPNQMMPMPNNNLDKINDIENKVTRLERQVRRLENKVANLESNYPTALSSTSPTQNQAQGYTGYDSGMYMM